MWRLARSCGPQIPKDGLFAAWDKRLFGVDWAAIGTEEAQAEAVRALYAHSTPVDVPDDGDDDDTKEDHHYAPVWFHPTCGDTARTAQRPWSRAVEARGVCRARSCFPAVRTRLPGPLHDQLVAAVLSGAKTSTSSLLEEYAEEDDSLPVAVQRYILVDSDVRAVGRGL
jgi:hypothetical protein